MAARGGKRNRNKWTPAEKVSKSEEKGTKGLEAWAQDNPSRHSQSVGSSGEDEESPDTPVAAGGGANEWDDPDTWAFWDEQIRPTPGAGKKPRVAKALPLPNPLPSLAKPSLQQADEDIYAGGSLADDDYGDDAGVLDFSETYDQVESIIMDINGERLKVPPLETYEDAANEFKLPPFIRAALAAKKYYSLTPVQKCALPLLLTGKDVLASAFTGTGKTAAFLLPVLVSVYNAARLSTGTLVASHYKNRYGERSEKPSLGRIKGFRGGLAAVDFQQARQLVPPSWVVGAPEPPKPKPWRGPARPSVVVMVPTRELGEQVHREALDLTAYSDFRSASLASGQGLRSQLRELAHGADIIVGTPGRVVDFLHRGVLKLDRVTHLVLDEVDRMMELGFGSQLQEIIEQGGMPTASTGRQTSFWSATIPHSVRNLAEAFLGRECIWVDCTGGIKNPVPNTIKHVVVDARPPHRAFRKFEPGAEVATKDGRKGVLDRQVGRHWRVKFTGGPLEVYKVVKRGKLYLNTLKTKGFKLDKLVLLKKILKTEELKEGAVIVFCRKRESATEVYEFLKKHFLGVVSCHGGMTQTYRSKAVKKMLSGEAEVLVATDVAARGLDIPSITHVINYEMPRVLDEFVHRCGRTGRMGQSGTAVTFVTGREFIFKSVRRTILDNLGEDEVAPEWFSLEGMQLPWRPRNARIPFTPVQEKLDHRAPSHERLKWMEEHRDRDMERKLAVMEQAALVACGEKKQSLQPYRRNNIQILSSDPMPEGMPEA